MQQTHEILRARSFPDGLRSETSSSWVFLAVLLTFAAGAQEPSSTVPSDEIFGMTPTVPSDEIFGMTPRVEGDTTGLLAEAVLSEVGASSAEERDRPRHWFVFLGLVNAYPKLESEKLVGDLFDPAMRLLAPGYDDVRTVRGSRDEHKLWVPQVGVGRVLGDRWSLYLQGGYAAGKVRTKANDRSIVLLPLHTDFEIWRAALSSTLGLDFYPFRVVELRKYEGLWDRLRGAKPKLGTSLTWTHATFDAKVKVGVTHLVNFLDIKLSDSWYLPSLNTNIGMDVPLSRRTSLGFNAGYNFFSNRKRDFEGPAFTVTWNYFFK